MSLSLSWSLYQEFSRTMLYVMRESQPPIKWIRLFRYASSKKKNVNYKISNFEDPNSISTKDKHMKAIHDHCMLLSYGKEHSQLIVILMFAHQVTTLKKILDKMKITLQDRSENRMPIITRQLQEQSARLAYTEHSKLLPLLAIFPHHQQFRLLCNLIRWTNPQLLRYFLIHRDSLQSLSDVAKSSRKQYDLSQSFYQAYENLAVNYEQRWIRTIDISRWINTIPSALEIIFKTITKLPVMIICDRDLKACLHRTGYLWPLLNTLKIGHVFADNIADIECRMTSFINDLKKNRLKTNLANHLTLPRMMMTLLMTIEKHIKNDPIQKRKTRSSRFRLFNEYQFIVSLISRPECYFGFAKVNKDHQVPTHFKPIKKRHHQ